MSVVWDVKADVVKKGDKKRDIGPIASYTYIDDNGFTHYFFSKVMFDNRWYNIPQDDFELFENFVNGGSRAYPSDGSIPCDVIAKEVRDVLKEIIACSEDPHNNYCQVAQQALKYGKFSLLRGTLKLYLKLYPNFKIIK